MSEKAYIVSEKPDIKRVVGQLNSEAFYTVKEEIKNRGLTVQSAVILGLIKLLELDLTLEQASPETNNK